MRTQRYQCCSLAREDSVAKGATRISISRISASVPSPRCGWSGSPSCRFVSGRETVGFPHGARRTDDGQRLCLRQNQITRIEFPASVAASLTELDLYDNLISHIKGLDEFRNLTSLDLSFNKIKHIKNVAHLVKLTDLYFVQNKISKIEGLEGLSALRNLELGANRIRVRFPLN